MDLVKLTPEEFKRFAKVIYGHTGIHLEESKLSLLSNRLRKRLRALNLASFDDYLKHIQSPKGFEQEEAHFLSAVTTNETYFFRNDALWRSMKDELIPSFVRQKSQGDRSIRVWSAASSTGAEAYTTAIMLRENLPEFDSWRISIIGSDISKNVLDQARAGVYTDYAVSRTTPDRVKRWFDQTSAGYQVRDEIKSLVKFQFHNLRDPFPGAKFDLVFLRNVLMYFDLEMKKLVLRNVIDAVAPGGHLIVGDVDPIRTIPELNQYMTLEYLRPGTYWRPAAGKSCAQTKTNLVNA